MAMGAGGLPDRMLSKLPKLKGTWGFGKDIGQPPQLQISSKPNRLTLPTFC